MLIKNVALVVFLAFVLIIPTNASDVDIHIEDDDIGEVVSQFFSNHGGSTQSEKNDFSIDIEHDPLWSWVDSFFERPDRVVLAAKKGQKSSSQFCATKCANCLASYDEDGPDWWSELQDETSSTDCTKYCYK